MPLKRFNFQAGIKREGTAYNNEGAFYDASFIRWRSGRAEKMGGWVKKYNEATSTFIGLCRKIHQWVNLSNQRYIALGTSKKLYQVLGDSFTDVTPLRTTTSAGDVTFAATNGSSTLTVTDSSHGAAKGDFVTFSGAATLGGLITAAVLNQEYEIATIASTNTYTITAKDTSGDTVTANASDSGNGGGSTVGAYQISIGLDVAVAGTGWGSGTWGGGTWGNSESGLLSSLRLWSIDNFGEDIIANVRSGGIYYWDATNPTNRAIPLSSLSGASNPPSECLTAIVSTQDRHVLAIGCTPFGGSNIDLMQIRWCDQGNAAQWTPLTTNTAGDLKLSAGSEIIGAIRGRQEVLVWTDVALYSLRFIGAPFIFKSTLITEGISMISPNAAINANNVVYFMDRRNFYIYTGAAQTLPCTVLGYVFDNLNQDQAEQVFAFANTAFNEVGWFYCTGESTVIDSYVTYNYVEKAWSIGTLGRTAWDDAGATSSVPLATNTVSDVGYVYNHETGYNADGSAMTAFLETADFDIDDGEHFAFVRRLLPDVEFIGSNTAPELTYTLKSRSDATGTLSNQSSTTVTNSNNYGVSNVRARGRQMRVRMESTDVDNAWRLGDVRLDIRQDGRR